MDRLAGIYSFLSMIALAIMPALVAGGIYNYDCPTPVNIFIGVWPVGIIILAVILKIRHKNDLDDLEHWTHILLKSKSSLEDEVKEWQDRCDRTSHHHLCRKRKDWTKDNVECNCIDIFHACANCPGQVPMRQA